MVKQIVIRVVTELDNGSIEKLIHESLSDEFEAVFVETPKVIPHPNHKRCEEVGICTCPR